MTPGPVAIYWSTFFPSANGGFIYMYNIYIKSEDMVSSLTFPHMKTQNWKIFLAYLSISL